MSLRLVVDHDRLWIPPELEERARARNAAIHAVTRQRVVAFRATRAGQDRNPWGGATSAEVGDDPGVSVRNSAEPARASGATPNCEAVSFPPPGAAHPFVPVSPWSSGRWLLAVPYIAAGAAALLGMALAYLLGGFR